MADYEIGKSLDALLVAATAKENKENGASHRILVGFQFAKESPIEVETAYSDLADALPEYIGNDMWKAICIKAELNTRYNKEYGSWALALEAAILAVGAMLVTALSGRGCADLCHIICYILIIFGLALIFFLTAHKHFHIARARRRLDMVLDGYIAHCINCQEGIINQSPCRKKTVYAGYSAGNRIVVDGQGNNATINYN